MGDIPLGIVIPIAVIAVLMNIFLFLGLILLIFIIINIIWGYAVDFVEFCCEIIEKWRENNG